MTHCNECGDLIPTRCYCHTCYAQLEAENARLKNALNDIIDYAEDWYWSYCEMWGQRRKEQQEQILANINKARVELGDEV
jgi:NifB/MoaA-like Fe-S oxidoreductase